MTFTPENSSGSDEKMQIKKDGIRIRVRRTFHIATRTHDFNIRAGPMLMGNSQVT